MDAFTIELSDHTRHRHLAHRDFLIFLRYIGTSVVGNLLAVFVASYRRQYAPVLVGGKEHVTITKRIDIGKIIARLEQVLIGDTAQQVEVLAIVELNVDISPITAMVGLRVVLVIEENFNECRVIPYA